MSDKFQDKVFLVTGGASGIGKTTAILFAGAGAKVVIADISPSSGQEAVREIQRSGGTAVFVQADVTKAGDVENLVAKTVESFGRLDFAFNNAGIDHDFCLTHELTEETFDKIVSINLKGIWLCIKYELAQMLKQGSGVIVNASSVAGLQGAPGIAAYSASKGGINQLTRTAAVEYAKMGIRVNSVCPGLVGLTGMTNYLEETNPAAVQAISQKIPLGRLAQPVEIANAVFWLCSDESSYITGVCLPVDGAMRA